MTTSVSFTSIERASNIVFVSPLLTLAAAVCDMLESAGIPAVLCREKGSPAVIVPPEKTAETRMLISASWYGQSTITGLY